MTDDWIVHPNRFEIGRDAPGRNGHFRTVKRRPTITKSTCIARVTLPRNLSHLADEDGTVTFAGLDWWFVVGAARTFARDYHVGKALAPFGFKRHGTWWWWDDTMSDESILDAPEAADHVREYMMALFPSATVDLADQR